VPTGKHPVNAIADAHASRDHCDTTWASVDMRPTINANHCHIGITRSPHNG